MIAQLLAFLLGAALASSWWALTVLPSNPDGWQFVLPGLVTAVFIVVFIFWCLVHGE